MDDLRRCGIKIPYITDHTSQLHGQHCTAKQEPCSLSSTSRSFWKISAHICAHAGECRIPPENLIRFGGSFHLRQHLVAVVQVEKNALLYCQIEIIGLVFPAGSPENRPFSHHSSRGQRSPNRNGRNTGFVSRSVMPFSISP